MKKGIAITLLSLLAGGFTVFGGFTLFSMTYNNKTEVIQEAPKPDPEATDNKNYEKALTAMDNQNYEQAINYFVSISSNYSKIDNVQSNLLKCLVSYINDIHQRVDEIVSDSNVDATSYTNAINLINKGLEYLDTLNKNNITLSDKLNKDYTYVQILIKIYKYRKDKEPFKALELYNKNENIFTDRPSFIDIKNSIIEDCKDEINDKINQYNSNQNYIDIIKYINGLNKEFINDYQNDKINAENNLLNKVKKDVNEYVDMQDYLSAKKCVDNYYTYLKKYEEFTQIYNKWHNYSDSKLIYKKITDDSCIERGSFSNIDGNEYSDVILLSKYNDEVSVEFALDKNYSNVSATLFLTNYNYNMSKEIVPLSILITDDQGNVLKQYDNLTYKNSIEISASISNIKYLRFTIKGKSNSVKIGIRNGILS